jgi:itaconyl-CoA hydratase
MTGRYYEDFELGATYHHRPGRTLSEADNTWFTLLTMNTHPIHFDAEYAKRTEFGKPLVVSTLTLAVLVGMSVADTSRNAVANLGWKEIRLPKPVFAGDTLYAESTVLETRESKSRPNEGIVTIRTLGRNQHGEVVCEFERTFLVMKRGHPLAERGASSGASY